MMAIRIRGMSWPLMWSEKTWLGFGQGTVVDVRTVMYDRRKQLKMKVSLRRKIHIMAFPQDTFLNARWSEDQSAAICCHPPGPVFVRAVCAIGVRLLGQEQEREQDKPDQQQEMPVGR